MKIPKTVAKWMTIGSLVGAPVTLFGGPVYFYNKKQEVLENSPTYMGAQDAEKQLLQYEKDIVKAAPRTNTDSVDQCVELTKKHDDLEHKLTALKNTPEYIATVKKADSMESHGANSPYLGLLFLVAYLIGSRAYDNRMKEEFDEKNPDYRKKLEELDKTIKR